MSPLRAVSRTPPETKSSFSSNTTDLISTPNLELWVPPLTINWSLAWIRLSTVTNELEDKLTSAPVSKAWIAPARRNWPTALSWILVSLIPDNPSKAALVVIELWRVIEIPMPTESWPARILTLPVEAKYAPESTNIKAWSKPCPPK